MKSIFVIDDSPETLASVSLVLEDAGYNVTGCREAYRAIDLCREIHFDLVICDVYMQGGPPDRPGSPLGGIDVIWSISEKFPALPIIAMSGFLEEEQLRRIQKVHVAGVLAKPFGREELLKLVESVLNAEKQ